LSRAAPDFEHRVRLAREESGVPGAKDFDLAGGGESLLAELTDGLEESVAHLAAAALPGHQRLPYRVE
jgi:hypothetical protein